ncbi:MAG: O-antigen ligase family protein [bacterium]
MRLLNPVGAALILCFLMRFYGKRIDRQSPFSKLTVLFVLSVILSPILSSGYIHGAIDSFWAMLPLLTLTIAGVESIRSWEKLRLVLTVLISCTILASVNSILQMSRGVGFYGIMPIQESYGVRVQAFGIFNNPNNLALLHAMIIPLLLGALLWPGLMPRVLTLPLLIINLVSLYETRSRGGQMAAMAGLFAFVLTTGRGSKKLFWGNALCILFLIMILPHIQRKSIDTHHGSERGRMEAWSFGLSTFKKKPFAGLGYGMWREHWKLDTHSSYVLSFAETGLVGFYFFIGMLFLGIKDSWRLGGLKREPSDPGEFVWYINLGHCLFAALIVYLVASLFQTRTYYLPLYLYLTMIAAITNLIRVNHEADQYFYSLEHDWMKTGILAAESIAGIYLFTRTLWRW